MKRLLVIALVLAFSSAASAAIVITLNGFRNVSVSIEPIGLCGTTGDCVFMATVEGAVLDSAGGERSRETLQFRTNDSAMNLNQTAITNFYRRSRRAWKQAVLAENAD